MRALFLSVSLCLLLPIVVAHASPPTEVTGSFTNTSSTITGVREAGGNVFIDQTDTWDYTGDFVGTSVSELTFVFHPNGKVTFSGTETLTGTGAGQSGTFVIQESGKSDDGALFEGRAVVISGTGGFENLHGQGTFDSNGAEGDYSVQIHFEPPGSE